MSSHLLDTAIGGVIALSGTFLAQWFGLFSSKIERRSKYASLQHERLERISEYVGTCTRWTQDLTLLSSKDSILNTHLPLDARRAVALCQIHFPDLAQVAINYIHALTDFHCFVLKSFDGDFPEGTSAGVRMFSSPEIAQHEKQTFSSRNLFDEAISKEARKYEPSA